MNYKYFQWSCLALYGADPVGADRYLRDNLEEIQHYAGRLLRKINYEPQTVHRGVILPEQIDGKLDPHPRQTYVSFTEDISIAERFADINHWMSFILRANGYKFGYMIEYTPTIDEILFHHSFVDLLPYDDWFISVGVYDNKVREQKEVTIIQPAESFTQIKRYLSKQYAV
jgi:hypothetical protein